MDQRTSQQNKACHVYFRLVAEALRKDGHTLTTILNKMKRGVELPVTEYLVKEIMWRPVQKALLNKQSTTELTKDEIDKIFEPINKFLGEQFQIYIPFPSEKRL